VIKGDERYLQVLPTTSVELLKVALETDIITFLEESAVQFLADGAFLPLNNDAGELGDYPTIQIVHVPSISQHLPARRPRGCNSGGKRVFEDVDDKQTQKQKQKLKKFKKGY